MTVAAWAANHVYTAGTLVNPTTSNGHSYRCSTAGTSAGTEPTWSGRFPAVTDGTAAWVPYTVITPTQLRSIMNWTVATGQYSDDIIGNNLLDAISALEQATRRYLVNRPGATVTLTSMVRAQLAIPGLRGTPTAVTYVGSALTASAYWLEPDAQQSGVFTGIAFRAFRQEGNMPWWYADSQWFDKALDSPFYPGNYGGGWAFSSMPNDTSITSDWGWEPTFEPGAFVHALEVLAAFYTLRAPTLLAESAITPQGGIVNYADMPREAQAFIRDWRAAPTAVSVG